jgi:hypothetical protein
MRHKCEVLDQHCERIGRDPSEIWRSTQALFLLDRDPEFEVRRAQLEATNLPVIAGSATRLQEAVGEYEKAGISELIVHDMALRASRDRTEVLAELYDEVFSAFADR